MNNSRLFAYFSNHICNVEVGWVNRQPLTSLEHNGIQQVLNHLVDPPDVFNNLSSESFYLLGVFDVDD